MTVSPDAARRASRTLRMPQYATFLSAALSALPQVAMSAAPAGEALFTQRGCAGCHALAPTKIQSLAERFALKGPDLWFAGSKLRADWLLAWLQNPTSLRSVLWNTNDPIEAMTPKHPALPPVEAEAVAAFLASRTDPYLKAGEAVASRLTRRQELDARALIEKKQACFACHLLRHPRDPARLVGGRTGPRLWDAGARLRPEWILAYLKSPEIYEPAGRMPVYGDKYTDDEYAMIVSYLATLR